MITETVAATADCNLAYGEPSHFATPVSQPDTPAANVARLIDRAIALLENDRAAARRCLVGASALLDCVQPRDSANGRVIEPPASSNGLVHWKSRKTLAYIEANLGHKMRVDDLADLVALSKSHFSREFKRTLGVPPMAFLAGRRVARAMLLMKSTESSLSEIAVSCGFADQSHLTRAFHRLLGATPGRWRSNHSRS